MQPAKTIMLAALFALIALAARAAFEAPHPVIEPAARHAVVDFAAYRPATSPHDLRPTRVVGVSDERPTWDEGWEAGLGDED